MRPAEAPLPLSRMLSASVGVPDTATSELNTTAMRTVWPIPYAALPPGEETDRTLAAGGPGASIAMSDMSPRDAPDPGAGSVVLAAALPASSRSEPPPRDSAPGWRYSRPSAALSPRLTAYTNVSVLVPLPDA